jgi:hypothetical protein
MPDVENGAVALILYKFSTNGPVTIGCFYPGISAEAAVGKLWRI